MVSDNFLLTTPLARDLYQQFAAPAPIFDFHCHVSVSEIAANRRFENLTQLWLAPDPYKHRAMRMAGVGEEFITGAGSDEQKFRRWSATVAETAGNPLFDWTALELERGLGIGAILSDSTATEIWSAARARLSDAGYSARALLARWRVAAIATSDRLLDDLSEHAALRLAFGGFAVLPSLRADDALAVESEGFPHWVRRLGQLTEMSIPGWEEFRQAISRRCEAFARLGCRLGDVALETSSYLSAPEDQAAGLFERRMGGELLGPEDVLRLRSGLFGVLAREHARRGWTLQLHLGAQRGIGRRLARTPGVAGGYAGMGRPCDLSGLCGLFDDLDCQAALPRMILYPLNPADFIPLSVLSGSFTEEGVPGKILLGAAWWYNDHRDGIRAQLSAVANHALIRQMPGMVTDARSLLSMSRHEYFRRVLCDWLGGQAAAGTLSADPAILGGIVRAIIEENPRRVLGV